MKRQYRNRVDRKQGRYRVLTYLCEGGSGMDLWTVQVRGSFGLWHDVKTFMSPAYDDVTEANTPLENPDRSCWSPEHIAAVELFESLINDI